VSSLLERGGRADSFLEDISSSDEEASFDEEEDLNAVASSTSLWTPDLLRYRTCA
jgi:hypothetical protein